MTAVLHSLRALGAHPTVRKVTGNVLALGLERVARLLVMLLVTAAVGRHLGPDLFGVYSAIFGLCTMFAISSDLGIGRVVVRDLVAEPGRGGTLMGTAVALRIGAVVVLTAVACGVAALIFPGRAHVVLPLAGLFGLGYILRGSDAVDLGFQAVTRGQYPALARTAALLAGAAANLWLMRTGASMAAFAAVFAAEGLLIAVGMVWVWRRWAPADYRGWRFDRSTARGFLVESWPMFVAFLYTQIYYRVDVILLERLASGGDAGIYTASARIYDILIGVLPLLSVSLFPTLTRWYAGDAGVFRERYARMTRWITWGGVVLLAGVWVVRKTVVDLIFGEEYLAAAGVLPWHLGSALVMYHAMFRAAYLTLCRRQIVLLWTSLLGAVLNVGLNLVLIPRFGAEGAAMAGLATQVVALVLSNVLFLETRWLLGVSLGSILPGIGPRNRRKNM